MSLLISEALSKSLRVRVGSGCTWVDAVGSGLKVRPEEKYFSVVHDHVRFLELRASGADRLHFPTLEDDPRFEALLYEIVVEGFLVLNDTHG
jgi:hypothetical protein